MRNLRLLPYKMGSAGCRELARELGILRVYPNRRFKPKERHTIINWGMGINPWPDRHVNWLNNPYNVSVASNKLESLQKLLTANINVPEFTTDINNAKEWYNGQINCVVYCRTLLAASGGRGIVCATSVDELVSAPLYTCGIQCRREYRAHVFGGQVIDITRKARRNEAITEANTLIRNHDNGWVFQREGFDVPEGLADIAIAAVNTIGLTFGAVDIVAEKLTGKLYVLEVNTAPGIEGTSVQKYAEAIRRYYDN